MRREAYGERGGGRREEGRGDSGAPRRGEAGRERTIARRSIAGQESHNLGLTFTHFHCGAMEVRGSQRNSVLIIQPRVLSGRITVVLVDEVLGF